MKIDFIVLKIYVSYFIFVVLFMNQVIYFGIYLIYYAGRGEICLSYGTEIKYKLIVDSFFFMPFL